MPGLNQLKKFSEDVTTLGNEPKRRQERGDTMPQEPFPVNASEADDSEDFVFGPPVEPENTESSNQPEAKILDPVLEDIDIDDLLTSVSSNSNNGTALEDIDFSLPGMDTMPDPSELGDFSEFDDISLPNENNRTVDLDSDPMAQLTDNLFPENDQTTIDNLPTAEDLTSSDELSYLDGEDNFSLDSQLQNTDVSTTQDTLEEVPTLSSDNDDFDDFDDFSSNEVFDLNEDLPENLKETSPVAPISNVDNNLNTAKNLSDDLPNNEFDIDTESLDSKDDFDLPDFNMTDTEFGDSSMSTEDASSFDIPNSDNFNMADGDAPKSEDSDDFDMPDFSSFGQDFDENQNDETSGGFSLPVDEEPVPGSFELPSFGDDFQTDSPVTNESTSNDNFDFNIDTSVMSDLNDNTEQSDVSDSFSTDNLDLSDFTPPSSDLGDFGLTNTPENEFSNGFESVDNNDEDEFSIPGFSDFELEPPVVGKNKKQKKGASSEDDKVDHKKELTDEEYVLFKKNLDYYPLNVKLAVEELIVKNEFTDDVVMDLILKILKKIPARQLATQLEKLLDKSIPVPLNYEKRTVSEYEAYKHSLEYQLKNRVLPLAIASVIIIGFCFLLGFLVGKFVVKPVRAEILYKEGYTLLENGMYPQSELKFNEAEYYKAKRSWFFKYAEGYASKKQYDRAAAMYERLLYRFKYNKQAGLDYAAMELNELANYEKAEEIVKRFILDYHINDKDGMLLLGDIFLDWATNKDASKFEDARLQYATLLQLYGNNDLYLSRMMRYFIRTDKLAEVLSLKDYFYPRLKRKPLEGQDLVELSGYLLEKQYAQLPVAEEYLRTSIEDVRELLEKAVEAAPELPEAMYNMGKYFVYTNNQTPAKSVLEVALQKFDSANKMNHSRILKNVDTYRMLGEIYSTNQEYLEAERLYAEGLSLFESEQISSALPTDEKIGILYSDLADIDYFISGDLNTALLNYTHAISNKNDTPSIRYRVGYIQYVNDNYSEALGSFIKTISEKPKEKNALYSLANTLSLRNSVSAAEGYYKQLLDILEWERNQENILFPQIYADQGELVDMYMKTANNLGVTLAKRAEQTGNSSLKAKAMSYMAESTRAWDALTRNQDTMVRLDGTNLAAVNLRYLSYPQIEFEPAIYTDIPRVLAGEKILEQKAGF